MNTKRLNKSGVHKVIKYLGEDRFTNKNINGMGDLLLGSFNEEDVSKINDIDIMVEHIGAGLHKVYHINEQDDEYIDDKGDGQSTNVSDALKKHAEDLIPVLSNVFPTKDEVEDALNSLKAQMIDPEEMINMLKLQIQSIKKQSGPSDEIGRH